MATTVENICQTAGCEKPAGLQCPSCIKLEISGSFFCSQVSNCEYIMFNNILIIIRTVLKDIGMSTRRYTKKS